MNYKNFLLLALSISAFSVLPVFGQGQPPVAAPARRPVTLPVDEEPRAPVAAPSGIAAAASQQGQLQSFAFEGAPLEVVMEEYCRWTDKLYLKVDNVKATITLKADKLTTEESIKVVEAILAMNNIALVPWGDRYVKVLQATAADLTGYGIPLDIDPNSELDNANAFITKIVQLQNVEIPEVQAAVQHVMHAYGKILGLQRSNSLMITDTEANIKRALEIIEFIDQATAGIDSRIYQIEHAEAQEIASKLKEIIEAAKGEDPTPTSNPYARVPAGVIRAGTRGTTTAAAAPTQASIGQTESGATTIIHGEVKVLADERTNLIIIFSQEENFEFFDKIIKVLDIEVEPATTFEVINLEYADAVDLSGTLNDLIGAATGGRSSSSTSRTGTSRTGSTASRTTGSTTGSRVTPNQAPGAPANAASINNLNRLSEDTKILADERSNSILLMGRKSDIMAIKEVIKTLDVMLEQVVIEAAIFEIGLTETLRYGMDWLYQATDGNKVGAWDGQSLIGSTNGLGTVASGALTYYQNVSGINTEVAINLAATDNDAKLLSTPVIMTTDNTEAILSIGEQRPVVTSTSSYANSSGTQSSTYEYKDIGIQLTVTPRINPQRFVVMEVNQTADTIGGYVTIDDNEVPVILNREFEAAIAVPDGGTVALGGLVQTEKSESITKIPLLGDIPFIGRYLFSSVSDTEVQRELVVLLTPYVMTDLHQLSSETERLYKGTNLRQDSWNGSWSESQLRYIPDPPSEEDDDEPRYTPSPAYTAPAATAPRQSSPNKESELETQLNQINYTPTESDEMLRMLDELNTQPAG
ncbi:type II secretion system secretin GspD [Pontiellaceae bacterium B1224]|nr:type II secretion system secretin GspD [Pontiellaceae bacterium B1224]